MSKIGHACKDENKKYSGGKAGDQTGEEVFISAWYKRPWNVVLIHPDKKIREKLAKAMEAACANNHIGYDQDATSKNDAGRYSLFAEARKVAFDLSKVSKDCETDCSNLVAACCNSAGLAVSEYIYTGNEKSALEKVGFKSYTDKKYTDSPDYIPRGAVLLYEGHHTAINLEDGKNWTGDKAVATKKIEQIKVNANLKIVGTTKLTIRKGPGTEYDAVGYCSTNQQVKSSYKAKSSEDVYWFNIGTDRWISGKYVEGWIEEANGRSWYCIKDYKYPAQSVEKINNKYYAFDKDGWLVKPSDLNSDGSIK